jgi:hypothetical protein
MVKAVISYYDIVESKESGLVQSVKFLRIHGRDLAKSELKALVGCMSRGA